MHFVQNNEILEKRTVKQGIIEDLSLKDDETIADLRSSQERAHKGLKRDYKNLIKNRKYYIKSP